MTVLNKNNQQGLRKRIHPNTFKDYDLAQGEQLEFKNPMQLLNAQRLDVVVRYIYARAQFTGQGIKWAKHIYKELIINQTNNFTKGALDPGRSTMPEYLESFDRLIESMQDQGYQENQSIIPTCENTIIDGAHRLAIALAMNTEKLPCIEMKGAPQKITFNDLKSFGVDLKVIHDVAREYVALKPQTRCAVMFPVSVDAHNLARDVLAQNFEIDFEHDVPLSFEGLKRLQTMLYGHHEWWSERNAHEFTESRFKNMAFVKLVFFQETEPVRPVKEKMRTHHVSNKHAFHTTDTHDETVNLANVFFNENAFFWLNHAINIETPKFDKLFKEYSKIIIDNNLQKKTAIDTGGVLALHGLRDVNDLDYITTVLKESALFASNSDIAIHEGEYEELGLTSDEILTDPRHHFYMNGLKFIGLNTLAKLKKYRKTTKDLYDLSLIQHLQTKDFFVWHVVWGKFKYKFKYKIYRFYHGVREVFVSFLRANLSDRNFTKIKLLCKKINL